MRLLFLGTGSAGAIPRAGHRDTVCQAARKPKAKSRRQRSAVLLSDQGSVILIDAGPDIDQQLKKAKPKNLDAVFITHGHMDAVAGLKKLDAWLGKNFLGSTIPYFTDRRTASKLEQMFGTPKNLKFVFLKSFEKQKIKSLVVMPFPVHHSFDHKIKTFGFLFGKNLAYASDTRGFPIKSKKLVKGVDTLILDSAMYFRSGIPTHLTVDASMALGAELGVKNLILTQLGHSFPPHEEAKKEVQKFFKKQNLKWPKKIILAFDEMRYVQSNLLEKPRRRG